MASPRREDESHIALIEFHDARLDSLSILPGGTIEVDLSHLVVYHTEGPASYEVRSHRARLRIEGAHQVSLKGGLASDDYIMDDKVLRSDGLPASLVDLLGEGEPIVEISFSFFHSARLSILCHSAKLALESEGEFLETWEGPLHSE